VKRHLVLVGLPGSGKSSVGRLAAVMLGTQCHDIDEAVERRTGRCIADVFAQWGEARFRELEREETERALTQAPAVIVPGGGWAAEPGNLESLGGRALTVYLETSPESAVERLPPDGGRPLLEVPDPVGGMRAILESRRSFYERSDMRISTEGRQLEDVARDVVELARRHLVG